MIKLEIQLLPAALITEACTLGDVGVSPSPVHGRKLPGDSRVPGPGPGPWSPASPAGFQTLSGLSCSWAPLFACAFARDPLIWDQPYWKKTDPGTSALSTQSAAGSPARALLLFHRTPLFLSLIRARSSRTSPCAHLCVHPLVSVRARVGGVLAPWRAGRWGALRADWLPAAEPHWAPLGLEMPRESGREAAGASR